MERRSIRKSTIVVSLLIALGIVITPQQPIYVPSAVQATSANNTSADSSSGTSGSTTSAQKLGKTTSTTTHLQAKNIQELVYKCAAGQKGVIISPGNFKISADKKNGKWSGTISIKGSTGEKKSGHIHSSTGKGISFSFTGNLDTRNTHVIFRACNLPAQDFKQEYSHVEL